APKEPPLKDPAARPGITPPNTTKPGHIMPPSKTVRVEIEFAKGEAALGKVTLELDEGKAPLSTKNFLHYLDDGFYQDTIIHRILSPGKSGSTIGVIQGGGYTAPSEKKTDGLQSAVRCEATNGLKNLRGTIAVARGPQPHTGTSQFFINT